MVCCPSLLHIAFHGTIDRWHSPWFAFATRACIGFASSQVLVVRWSLDVLDVLLGLDFDATVLKLLIGDGLSSSGHRALSVPVPHEATNVLQTRHLLIGQVRENLERVTTVSINAEHIVPDQVPAPGSHLEEDCSEDHSTDNPFALHAVLVHESLDWSFLHFLYIFNYYKLTKTHNTRQNL